MTTWDHVHAALNGILDRRWYTNHGPLARLLEAEWADATGRKHAIAVVNPTIGLIMMSEALGLSGEVALSALAPPRCVQALSWAGLTPRFCDIDPQTLGPDLATVSEAASVLATPGADAAVSSARVFGDGTDGLPGPTLIDLPAHGDEAGAGCILTDDDHLAALLRNIRSSYGAGLPLPVLRTANGRMSEAQAAMALLEPLGWSALDARLGPIRGMFPGRQVIAHGKDVFVVAKDTSERERMCVTSHARPFVLDSRAAHCAVAASIAERALVVDPAVLARRAA